MTGNYVRGRLGGIQVGVTPRADVRLNVVEMDRNPLCYVIVGIQFSHNESGPLVARGSIIENAVLNADTPFDYAVSPTVRVCGNRTTATGAFDQPNPC